MTWCVLCDHDTLSHGFVRDRPTLHSRQIQLELQEALAKLKVHNIAKEEDRRFWNVMKEAFDLNK